MNQDTERLEKLEGAVEELRTQLGWTNQVLFKATRVIMHLETHVCTGVAQAKLREAIEDLMVNIKIIRGGGTINLRTQILEYEAAQSTSPPQRKSGEELIQDIQESVDKGQIPEAVGAALIQGEREKVGAALIEGERQKMRKN